MRGIRLEAVVSTAEALILAERERNGERYLVERMMPLQKWLRIAADEPVSTPPRWSRCRCPALVRWAVARPTHGPAELSLASVRMMPVRRPRRPSRVGLAAASVESASGSGGDATVGTS